MKKIILFLLTLAWITCGHAQTELLFVADTQEPIWIEKVFIKDKKNREASDSLFFRILQQNPASVFFLGDMVAKGSDDNSWARIDILLDSLKQKQIPYYGLKGNHEYLFKVQKGITNYSQRFSNANIQVVTVDSISVVLLNSNFDHLSKDEKATMLSGYEWFMDSLQRSTAVKSIIVCIHHSPYTNSSIVSPSKDVQNLIVPKYLATPKAILFLSGHSHNLEIFENEGKYFCVIGGGGGLKQKLKDPKKQEYKQVLPEIERLRFFYITAERKNNVLLVKAHGMNSYAEPEKTIDLLWIKIP